MKLFFWSGEKLCLFRYVMLLSLNQINVYNMIDYVEY